jgi:integrase
MLIEWQFSHGFALVKLFARWADIDRKLMWNIPAEFMKMKKPHKVPLSKEALRFLN